MSVRVLIVADDFTGGNAAAGLLACTGLRCANVLARRRAEVLPRIADRFDALVVTAETRHLPAAQARDVVADIVRESLPVDLVSNRIDTTLRGNLAATTAGALDAVRGCGGPRAVALCVPAHPAAGRQTVDGHQLLDGVRLEETEAARDPRFPIASSVVADALALDPGFTVEAIALQYVTGPRAELVGELTRLADGADAIVVDALTEEHLARIAAAAAAVPDVTWVAVDPGPFTRELVAVQRPAGARPRPVLAMAGSTSELTRRQLQRLVETLEITVVDAAALADTDGERTLADVVDRAVAALSAGGAVPRPVLVSTVEGAARIGATAAEAIAGRLGRTARMVLERVETGGLYLTGGDVASAVLTSLGASGLAVEAEVLPLAVFGAIIGGDWDGLNVITKGGLVGDADAAVSCIRRLADAAESAQLAPLDDHLQATRS